MLKKFLCFTLIFSIILSIPGCNKNKEETNNNEIPTYYETHFAQAAGLINPAAAVLNSKGQIVIYDWGQSPPSFITIDSEGNRVNAFDSGTEGASVMFTLDASDDPYVLSQKRVIDQASGKHTANEVAVKIFSSSGSLTKSIDLGTIPVNNERESSFTDIAVNSKGNIYLLKKDGSIDVLNNDGQLVDNIKTGKYIFLETDINDDIIVCGLSETNNAFIEAIDPDKKSILWKLDLEQPPLLINYYPSDNSLYILDALGIKKCDLKKRSVKPIMDFTKNNPGNGIDISGMVIESPDTIYITAFNKNMIQKYTLSYDPVASSVPVPESPKKELTFYTNYGGDLAQFLPTVSDLMKVKYPDIEIKFIIADFNNHDDQLKSLYTAIMAGSGPDVIDVSYLPYKKLAEKKLLVNLSEIIDNDKEFDKNLYYQNIMGAAKYNGILYIMPVNYRFDGFVADDEVLAEENIAIDDLQWTWDDFYNISLKLTKDTGNDGVIDRYAFYSRTNTMITRYLSSVMHLQFVDQENKSCSFNTEECVDFLNTFKKLMENNIRHPTQGWEPVSAGALSKQFVFMPADVFNVVTFSIYKKYMDATEISFYQFPRNISNNKVSCILTSALGINANSKLKDESWNLIKCMLRDEVQASGWLNFTINKNAEIKGQQQWMQGTMNILNQSEFEKLNSLIESCNDILYVDDAIKTIIRNETEQFFSGQKTAEEVAQAIQDKATTYLNE